MTISEKIIAGRRRKGCSQQVLADLCGVSKRTIASYETDGRRPHPGTLRRLAGALGCTVDYLTDDSIGELPVQNAERDYIAGLRDVYGSDTADEIEALIQKSTAYFAGGRLTQEAKDKYFLALTNAYIACRNAADRDAEEQARAQTDRQN